MLDDGEQPVIQIGGEDTQPEEDPQNPLVEVPTTIRSTEFWAQLTKFELIYSLCGLALGLACIVGGMVLFFYGITGSIQWILSLSGVQSKIANAAPGVVLFIVGMFVVYLTKYEVRAVQAKRRRMRRATSVAQQHRNPHP